MTLIQRILTILMVVSMMAAAGIGMFLFIAGIAIAVASPLIIITWLIIQAI